MNITNLKQFQETYPTGCEDVDIDIVGFCNAKCKYCPAYKLVDGAEKKFMSVEKYEEILKKLMEYRMLTDESNLNIYSLGEPCLHPQLNDILVTTAKYNRKVCISTNVSTVPKIDINGIKAISRFILSMPGFSQSSYDKIHGFNFETIKKNILRLKNMVDELTKEAEIPKITFDLSYHIYQFNLHEIPEAKKFCEENGIIFSLNYAVLFSKTDCMDYVTNQTPYEKLKDMSKELMLGILDYQIEHSPRDYCDFQSRYLIINVDGDVKTCGGMKKEADNIAIIGNILSDDIDEVLRRKYNHKYCDKCIDAGLTLSNGYDCKVWPDFYYSLMKENEYITNEYVSEEKSSLNRELKLMHAIRYWENDHYSEDSLLNVKKILNATPELRDKLSYIVLKYGRFKAKTMKKLEQRIGE